LKNKKAEEKGKIGFWLSTSLVVGNMTGSGIFLLPAALALWAFLGLESATIPSDNVKNPTKTIPRAAIAGIITAALLYISSTVGVMGIMAPAELQNSAAPFADAAQKIWGDWASVLIAIPAFLYSLWAITGLESEVLLWGAILLTAGVPMYIYLRYKSKKD